MSKPIIEVHNMWKRYGFGLNELKSNLLGFINNKWAFKEESDIWALKDIDFTVQEGDALGIVGRNGAGKSTLLKVLAGVTPHTRGTVKVRCPVFPMIELNAGLHMDLTGRENVYLLGSIMGLSRSEVRKKLPAIEEFCELGPYFEERVRKYSSGMLARLGFSVAIHVDVEVLLIDEVLSVGDFGFQNKCQSYFRRSRGNKTLLYVTHDRVSLPYICDNTMYLVDGMIKSIGPSQEIIAQYERDSLSYAREVEKLPDGVLKRDSSGQVDIIALKITDTMGNQISEFKSGQSFLLSVEGVSHVLVKQPLFAFAILDSIGNICWWNFSFEDGSTFDPIRGHFKVTAQVPSLPLRGGSFNINFTFRDGEGFVNLERLYAPSLTIRSEGRAHGILASKAVWSLES